MSSGTLVFVAPDTLILRDVMRPALTRLKSERRGEANAGERDYSKQHGGAASRPASRPTQRGSNHGGPGEDEHGHPVKKTGSDGHDEHTPKKKGDDGHDHDH